jgi:serine/threonine protein kinase/Tol biopolymer transport system component
MALAPGIRLGPYEILESIGAGGMGEVYKARDTRLGRVVAVKVSQAQFSERFEREARAVAALNHPHICHLYDVGPNFLVMEYVEGGPIKATEDSQKLVDVAGQIADGLAAAHAAGIVHRDLKPANILMTRDGRVKILDFGLALIGSASIDAGNTAGLTALTDRGTTIGTAAYMSPEQARGEPLDARTDLWSFGVVLYEMATGVRPFNGSTAAVVFRALLADAPVPVRERSPKVSAELGRIIDRLLEKDREVRYQTAADVRADLRRVGRDSSAATPAVLASGPDLRTASKFSQLTTRRKPLLAAGVMVLALAAAALVYFSSQSTTLPVTSPSEYVQITDFTEGATDPALSPDGRMLTFIRGGQGFPRRGGQIYVKLLPNGESVRLTDTVNLKYGPVFSPDASRIAYTEFGPVEGSLSWDTWTVPALGGPPTRFLPNAAGLIWIDDRRVLFSEIMGTGLHMGIVTATEGRAEERAIYYPDHERAMAHYSYPSPDRRWVLISEMDRTAAFQSCRVVPFDASSSGRQVGPRGECTSAAWSQDGRWMYFSVRVDGAFHLWRERFPGGTPEQITFGPTQEEGVALAPDGRFIISSVGQARSAVWIHDVAGERALSAEGFTSAPRLSADGKRVYFLLRDNPMSTLSELRSIDLTTGKTDRALPGISVEDFAISPDEREVAYTTRANGESEIWLAFLDRRQPPRRVIRAGDQVSFGAGDELIFRRLDQKMNVLARVKKDGTGLARIGDAAILGKFGVSPDGQWTAVGAPGSSGTSAETIVVSTKDGSSRVLCRFGCPAVWSPRGDILYLMLVTSAGGSLGGRTEAFLGKTIVVQLPNGRALPEFAASGAGLAAQGINIPGASLIDHAAIVPGPDSSTYAFVQTELRTNLFRIPLR